MHTWARLLLAATAFAASVPLDRPQERGLYIEDNSTLSSFNGSQVSSTELPNHGITAGGVEKNNATQPSIKISDALSLQSSPSNISAPTSLQNKDVTDIYLSPKTINKTGELGLTRPIPIYQSFGNTSSQSNNTQQTKVSKSSKINSRIQEGVVPLEPETIPTKLPNEDAFADRSLDDLKKVVKMLTKTKSNNTDAEYQAPYPVPQQNASLPASRKKMSTKISVKVTPSTSTRNITDASKSSKTSHESNTGNETNITRKAENTIQTIFSDIDSSIDIHSCHAVQAPSLPSQVERNPDDDDDDDLKSNDRKSGSPISPKREGEDRSTNDHVLHNETVT